MSDDLSDKTELKIIQEHLNLQSGNVLLFSNNSELTNCLSSEILNIFSSTDQNISDRIDILLSTNTLQVDLLKYNQKFDTVIIHDLLEEIKHPELFLQNLNSILNDEGVIISSISNFYHINNIINLLTGQLAQNYNFDKTLRLYDLDKILFLLNKNNMHISKIFRIKEEISSEKINLDNTLVPSKLIDMIEKIPDYDTLRYVLMISKGKITSHENLQFLSEFPKNYLLPQLEEHFKTFLEYETAISKKDKVIQGYENSIQEQDTLIQGYENSIQEQDTLIQGYENSIQEQQNYIKNLEEHIHALESQLKKFKFWKR